MKTKQMIKSIFFTAILLVSIESMAQNKNIVETAVSTEATSTLATAVKAADLVDVLSSEGPFTVFAPTNDAFNKLPEGTVASLLKPENKSKLQTILKYHVVAGKFEAADVIALIKKNNGKAKIKTVSGGSITAWMKDGAVYIQDENGNSAKVIKANLDQTNGVIHVIDSVVLPK